MLFAWVIARRDGSAPFSFNRGDAEYAEFSKAVILSPLLMRAKNLILKGDPSLNAQDCKGSLIRCHKGRRHSGGKPQACLYIRNPQKESRKAAHIMDPVCAGLATLQVARRQRDDETISELVNPYKDDKSSGSQDGIINPSARNVRRWCWS